MKEERAEQGCEQGADPLGEVLGVAPAECRRLELHRVNEEGGGLGDDPRRTAAREVSVEYTYTTRVQPQTHGIQADTVFSF